MNTARIIRTTILAAVALAATHRAPATPPASQPTVIEITNKCLVDNVEPFGFNLFGCGEFYAKNYQQIPLMKRRIAENFEGSIERYCMDVKKVEGTRVTVRAVARIGTERRLAPDHPIVILSGPEAWQTRHVVKAEAGGSDEVVLTLDHSFAAHPEMNGIMIEFDNRKAGFFSGLGSRSVCSPGNALVHDTALDSFGYSSLAMTGDGAFLRFPIFFAWAGKIDGPWRIQFKARAPQGKPTLTIAARDGQKWATAFGTPQSVSPNAAWKSYTVSVPVEPARGKPDDRLLGFEFKTDGGDVHIDDIEAVKEDEQNPTMWRDDFVNLMKDVKVGSLRHQWNKGTTMENVLQDKLHAFAFGGGWAGTMHHGAHEVYTLCEAVGANPYYTTPGTLTPGEMQSFIEFIAAPADVGWGKLRAAHGHPRPWSDVFQRIDIEIGNEPFTFGGSGYMGPDYWRTLIEAGKSSPYYKSNIKFNVNYFHKPDYVRYTSNADTAVLGGYTLQTLDDGVLAKYMPTDTDFFRFLLGFSVGIQRNKPAWRKPVDDAIDALHLRKDIYETNYHTTYGTGGKNHRQKIFITKAGGVSFVNYQLQRMTEGIRAARQYSFNSSIAGIGDFKNLPAATVATMRGDNVRYKPYLHAVKMANSVIGGDMLKTSHSGNTPVFSTTGSFEKSGQRVTTYDDLPAICSYAFADGNRRGLILVNLDVETAHEVAVTHPWTAVGPAKFTTLTGNPGDDNELEHEERVFPVVSTIPSFRSGQHLVLPECSFSVLAWETSTKRVPQ
jgi:alpha-L-arabinofuranosidase